MLASLAETFFRKDMVGMAAIAHAVLGFGRSLFRGSGCQQATAPAKPASIESFGKTREALVPSNQHFAYQVTRRARPMEPPFES
jgi:hypothetical protein